MKKQVLRATTVISMMIATASFVGCGGSDHHQDGEHHGMDGEHHQMDADSTAHHMEHTYACPMHPAETGHEGDKCGKCGMDLEEVKE